MGYVLTLIIGLVSGFLILKASLAVTISKLDFNKAEAICLEQGSPLLNIKVYSDRDVFYCDNLKIIAKKDSAQGMWTEFEIVRPKEIPKED